MLIYERKLSHLVQAWCYQNDTLIFTVREDNEASDCCRVKLISVKCFADRRVKLYSFDFSDEHPIYAQVQAQSQSHAEKVSQSIAYLDGKLLLASDS